MYLNTSDTICIQFWSNIGDKFVMFLLIIFFPGRNFINDSYYAYHISNFLKNILVWIFNSQADQILT